MWHLGSNLLSLVCRATDSSKYQKLDYTLFFTNEAVPASSHNILGLLINVMYFKPFNTMIYMYRYFPTTYKR